MSPRRSLDLALSEYLTKWGPLQWRSDITRPVELDPVLASALRALSTIEHDSLVIHDKIRAAGVLRDPAIREFSLCWLAEEAEHARALAYLAVAYGDGRPPARRSDLRPRLRQTLAWPTIGVMRALGTRAIGAYGALGMAQEFVALSTYSYLSRRGNGQPGSRTLTEMARQESRHMRFYRSVAEEYLPQRGAQGFARSALLKLWRPPGFDALGTEAWLDAFQPLLADDSYVDAVRGLDRLMDKLPGLQGLNLVDRFLAEVQL
jgi:hypothetical protein